MSDDPLQLGKALVEANAEIERLRALNAELLAALRPFALQTDALLLVLEGSKTLRRIDSEDLLRAENAIIRAEMDGGSLIPTFGDE